MTEQRSRHQVFVDELPAADHETLWQNAQAIRYEELRSDPARQERDQRRKDASLLSAAIALHERLSRSEIQELSDRACQTANLSRVRCELGYWGPFKLTGPGAAMFTKAGLAGCVVAAFHFGDYRMLPVYLAAQGLDVDLLSDPANASRFASTMRNERVHRHLNAVGAGNSAAGLSEKLHSLSSASRMTTWQLLADLRKGHVALIFPDGNLSADATGVHQGHAVVADLLGRKVLARPGASILAYAAKTCVVPVFPYCENGKSCLQVLDSLSPEAAESLQSFRDRVSRTLFEQLGAEIERRPSEWEEWHNYFRWLAQAPPPVAKVQTASAPAEHDMWTLPGPTRLTLVDQSLWRLKVSDEWHVVDVRLLQSLGTDVELGRLVSLAESGATINDWRGQILDFLAAQEALSFLLSSGRVRLHR